MRCAIGQGWDATKQQCLEAPKKQVKSWFNYQDAFKEMANIQQQTGDEQWRLPTIDELQTLIEYNCQDPATNIRMFPNAPSWKFWSETPLADNLDYAWVVDFSDGSSSTRLKTISSHYIRLVKGQRPVLDKQSIAPAIDQLAPWNDGIHDLDNPSITMLQPFARATSDFPTDSSAQPNWVETLQTGFIKPRVSYQLIENDKMVTWQQDIVYKDTFNMPWVKFPHLAHSQWLACDNCHDEIFMTKRDTADISMASIYTGQHCGQCHGKVAFSINTCERCHSVLHDKVSQSWIDRYPTTNTP
jgi:c(7)-type cytochrome triheme protein